MLLERKDDRIGLKGHVSFFKGIVAVKVKVTVIGECSFLKERKLYKKGGCLNERSLFKDKYYCSCFR